MDLERLLFRSFMLRNSSFGAFPIVIISWLEVLILLEDFKIFGFVLNTSFGDFSFGGPNDGV